MATTKKTTIKRSHERLGWLVAVILLLLLLLGFMAAYYKWWPFAPGTTTPTTTSGTSGAGTTAGTSGAGTSSGGSSSSSGSSGSNGANGTNGSNGSSAMVGSDLFNLYGQIASGQTKDQVLAQAGSIKPDCTAVNAAQVQVCTYTQGDKVVTVTYQNGQVASVAKSGF